RFSRDWSSDVCSSDLTSLYIAGDFVNNGLYVSSTTTYLADYSNASNDPTNVAQTISGTGQFHNASITASTLPTLNDVIYSLNVNNSSTGGVTLARSFGLSNVLTLTEGRSEERRVGKECRSVW